MSAFLCDCHPSHRSACEGLPFYAEHEGQQYCVLHSPLSGKEEDLWVAVGEKLQRRDFDFRGVFFSEGTGHFPNFVFDAEADFGDATFEWAATFTGTFKEEANFRGAVFLNTPDFTSTVFEGNAMFTHCTFEGGIHCSATFHNGADFTLCRFSDVAVFIETKFEGGAQFMGATFEKDANFWGAAFRHFAIFAGAVFGARATFSGMQSFNYETYVNFQNIRVEHPDQFVLHTVALRPSWFIDVDARQFNFTNVKWYGLANGLGGTFEDEIHLLRDTGGQSSPHSLLAKACRELSINAEENRRYAEATELNYWALDAQRKELRGSIFAPWTLIWWYWALSGYGERHLRSALWLAGILFTFAIFYLLAGLAEVREPSFIGVMQAFWEATVYSGGAMTRQNAAIAPSEPVLLRSLVFLEGVLGPLQIALFALAVRRKFMR